LFMLNDISFPDRDKTKSKKGCLCPSFYSVF
jgi:hypothetical protein